MSQAKPPADTGNAQRADPGPAQRSESLLPAGADDDGRFDVAEEVSLDQQSDQLRRVGKPPKPITAAELPDDPADETPSGKGA